MIRVATNAASCCMTQSHMISIRVRRRFESPASHKFPSYYTTMASSVSDIAQKLNALSIKPLATVSHAKTSPSLASWKDALIATGSAPASFELIKTLVYKPKTAKTAVPVPVVVVAREETANLGAIGKKLNLKDLRLASEDLLTEFFSLDKDSCKWKAVEFSALMTKRWMQYLRYRSQNPPFHG